MNILAFDTSGEALEVAVRYMGRTFLDIRYIGLKHSEILMPVVDTVLANAGAQLRQMDLLICAGGPGSFTGLRIGMSTAKGLCAATGIPLVSVSTLDAMAFGYDFFDGVVVPVIDAKKRRVYSALYRRGKRITAYMDLPPADLLHHITSVAEGEPVLFLGTGVGILQALTEVPAGPSLRFSPLGTAPRILSYISLGEEKYETSGGDADDAGPTYLRKSDAELSRM